MKKSSDDSWRKPFSFPFHFLFLLLQLAVPVLGYSPAENIAIDCGSSSNATALDSRPWIADTIDSNSFTFSQLKNNASEIHEARQQYSANRVPYLTARLSYSPFTYSFAVSEGQKFVRLHFYPASYPNFENSRAFFSVKAGRFTLLSNFTASAVDSRVTIVKEFCVSVQEGERLNVSFVPTSSAIADAFAFINGIEIVSMPTNLYYSEAWRFLGTGTPLQIGNETALETMYRINVGGNAISPADDTGMFREWLDDTNYLTQAKPSAVMANRTLELNFTKIQNNTAPAEVYQTGRGMGPNGTANLNYNLTWTFSVDSGFVYLVRLHFCEFVLEGNSDRVFQIFIGDLLAEDRFALIVWGGAIGVPFKKDYALMVTHVGGMGKKQNLTVKLHANPESISVYPDAFLNGVEIFKRSTSNGNLAGSNPEIPPPIPSAVVPPSAGSSKSNQTTVFGIVGGVVGGILVVSFLFFLIFRKRLKGLKGSGSSDGASWWDSFISSSVKSSKDQRTYLPSDLCYHFSLAEIKAATNNFNDSFIIGHGGFGNVYKGFIKEGAVTVAIKRLNPDSQQGATEFKTEIETLSQLRHVHLVSLIGYCNEHEEMILVYDYMAHGTLRDHLYNTKNPPLPWKQRLEICIGAARGLQYLHSGAKQMIIHRDVKTTNILLDEKWVAKVSDFGLSKIGPTNMSKAHVSTVVKGSFGYLDPEYYRSQQLTEKSDVYSFGVVLCEILSARPPVSRSATKKPVSLAEWFRQCYRNETIREIIDPYLKGKISPECLKQFTEVTMKCLLDNVVERPSIGDVVWSLEFALQLQEEAGQEMELGEVRAEIDIEEESLLKGNSINDGDDFFNGSIGLAINSRIDRITLTSTSDEQNSSSSNSQTTSSSGAVFSQITNQTGR